MKSNEQNEKLMYVTEDNPDTEIRDANRAVRNFFAA